MTPRILYTTADASPQSGAFRSLLYMSRGITEHGYEPILALHGEGRENPLLTTEDLARSYFFDLPRVKRGRSMRYYWRYAAQNIRSIYELVKLIRQEQVAIVHINEILDFYAGIAALTAGVPCVWHVRADLAKVPWLRWMLTRTVLALADRIIVVSRSVQERMFQERGKEKVNIINNPGPDLTQFHPNVNGSLVREEFALNDGAFLVTLVGKLSNRKGHETLVRAAPRILSSLPKTHFMLVGGEIDAKHHKDYAKRLKSLVQTLDIQDRVIFTGFRSDIPQIMAASDVIIHCSTYPDPFPGVVLQGMAVGKPVIASDLGGPREQIEHGISGVLVEPGNPDALAENICYLLADDKQRRRLGEAAAARVNSTFTPELFFQKLSSLYQGLIK